MARSVLERDGEHVAMYFVAHADGRVAVCMFDEEDPDDSVGASRARQLADAVEDADADAVVVVSEAWSAGAEDVPVGGRVRDASQAEDVLLLVGADRSGETVLLETPIYRAVDGAIRLGATITGADDWEISTLGDVRAVWGLPPR